MNWDQLLSVKRFGQEHRVAINEHEIRSEFQRDYDRLIFSSPFRRLQNKTQVFPLPGSIFVHNRLTHSLEVSSVGRSLGNLLTEKLRNSKKNLNNSILDGIGNIVATACLAHDLGNPPFGHSGEEALSYYFTHSEGKKLKSRFSEEQWADLCNFEGNANAFRLLTHSFSGRRKGGFALTYTSVASIVKYPWEALKIPEVGKRKYGFFNADKENYTKIAKELGLPEIKAGIYARHPLVYLVEAADDICYTIIDFEDGINLGLISEDYALEYLIKLVKDRINTKKYNELAYKEDRLSYLRALAISTLINDAIDVFAKNEEAILEGTFDVSLLDKSKYTAQIDDIITLSVKNIYRSQEVL